MSTKSPHIAVPSKQLSEDAILDYAYDLYDQSGFAASRDLDNWLEAKACLGSGIPKSESNIRLHQNSFRKKQLPLSFRTSPHTLAASP
jgi:hypothetical protein